MKTVRGVAALGAAVILLAGCGADAEPKFEADPSGAPSSVSPSPDEPAPWEENTPDGAVAFVEHWIDVFDTAKATGDVGELRMLSSKGCESCHNFIETTTEIYSQGGYIRSQGWKVLSVSEPQQAGELMLVATRVLQTPQRVQRSSVKKVERFEGGKIDLEFRLRREDGWVVSALEPIQ